MAEIYYRTFRYIFRKLVSIVGVPISFIYEQSYLSRLVAFGSVEISRLATILWGRKMRKKIPPHYLGVSALRLQIKKRSKIFNFDVEEERRRPPADIPSNIEDDLAAIEP